MSDTTSTLPDRLASRTDRAASALPGPVPALAAVPVRLARFVGFCAAVTVPFAYLPLLAGGLPGAGVETFAGLVAVNCVGLVLGRNYGRDPAADATDDADAVEAGTDDTDDATGDPVTPDARGSAPAEGTAAVGPETPETPGTPAEPAASGAAD
jgi:hypothetical protein